MTELENCERIILVTSMFLMLVMAFIIALGIELFFEIYYEWRHGLELLSSNPNTTRVVVLWLLFFTLLKSIPC